MSGIINICKTTGCGFKCCSFGSTSKTGYTIMLPNEYENADKNVSHLKIIDDDYFGGKKVQCTAKSLFDCDGGYKPIQCRVYPIWMESLEKDIVLKSLKCPIQEVDLPEHKRAAIELFKSYDKVSKEELDVFLSKVTVDRYKVFGKEENAPYEIKPLTMDNLDRVVELEDLIPNSELCYRSHKYRIVESIKSNCSVGVFVDNLLVAYSLCYTTEYGTAYIEKCFVHETFRGQGWQVEMLLKNIALCEAIDVNIFHTMASPKNWSSIRSFKQVGFVVSKIVNFGNNLRAIMHKGDYRIHVSAFVDKALSFHSDKYVYIYGGKQNVITAEFIEKMANAYPSIYTNEVIEKCKTKIGKIGIDCSGLITISANIPNINTDALYEYIETKYSISDLTYIKNGMVVWTDGHIGLVYVDEKNEVFILEAKDSFSDIIISPVHERISAFKYYGALSNIQYSD
jgi:hypothetical protein